MNDTPKQRGGKRDRAGRKPRPDRVSITVRVARGTAEKLRAWAEGPRKIGELIDRLVEHRSKDPDPSRHLVDLSGVDWRRKKTTGTSTKATQTLWFFPKNTENPQRHGR